VNLVSPQDEKIVTFVFVCSSYLFSWICGSRSGDYEECYFLGFKAVSYSLRPPRLEDLMSTSCGRLASRTLWFCRWRQCLPPKF
jgi:hypothetical protein